MKAFAPVATGLAAAVLFAGSAHAAPAFWTDWTTTTATSVTGSLSVGSENVTVTYTGPSGFVQTAGGINYWLAGGTPGVVDAPYTGAVVDNGPPDADIIALNGGGSKTITFSQPVVDPLIALVSWNGNVVDFGTSVEILTFGAGHWGNGTPVLNAAGTGFTGSGEVHGVIRLPGTHDSITFTDTSENWHGFTLGVLGVGDGGPGPDPTVPAPLPLALFGIGLAAMGLLRRRA